MVLQELSKNQQLIVQIIWGEKTIEFHSKMVDSYLEGIFITPYLHNNQPLELNVGTEPAVKCNLFADDFETQKRISWRNVKFKTVRRDGNVVYFVTTSGFNKLAQTDERRGHDRVFLQVNGVVSDHVGNTASIVIRDISDNGISFYAPDTFAPVSSQVTVRFADRIQKETVEFKLNCRIVRVTSNDKTLFYGCELMNASRDYLLYGCTKRMKRKRVVDM